MQALPDGLTGHAEHVVTKDLAPSHISRVVLSTPSMINLIELTCHDAVRPYLEAGETTVGTHVCVSHAAAAVEGELVSFDVVLTEVDRRRLEFSARVTCGDRVLSDGTHQRFVVRDEA